MFRLLVVLALLSCVYGISRSKHHVVKKHGQKIIGGEDTTIEKYPYLVSLFAVEFRQRYLCGGSIISDQWILTSAHCLQFVESFLIRAGSSYIYAKGNTYPTKKYIIHPNYSIYPRDNDVALVNVPGGMKLNNITMKAVTLAPSGTSLAVGTKTIVSGWGDHILNGQPSTQLRSAQIPIVSHSTCSRNYKTVRTTVANNMLCAGGIEDLGICRGDEGDPQVLESGEQVGVASFVHDCGWDYFPGVFTKVENVRSWIKEVTGV